jgi:hypothetical protein
MTRLVCPHSVLNRSPAASISANPPSDLLPVFAAAMAGGYGELTP